MRPGFRCCDGESFTIDLYTMTEHRRRRLYQDSSSARSRCGPRRGYETFHLPRQDLWVVFGPHLGRNGSENMSNDARR
jgi:hypothetical protein